MAFKICSLRYIFFYFLMCTAAGSESFRYFFLSETFCTKKGNKAFDVDIRSKQQKVLCPFWAASKTIYDKIVFLLPNSSFYFPFPFRLFPLVFFPTFLPFYNLYIFKASKKFLNLFGTIILDPLVSCVSHSHETKMVWSCLTGKKASYM